VPSAHHWDQTPTAQSAYGAFHASRQHRVPRGRGEWWGHAASVELRCRWRADLRRGVTDAPDGGGGGGPGGHLVRAAGPLSADASERRVPGGGGAKRDRAHQGDRPLARPNSWRRGRLCVPLDGRGRSQQTARGPRCRERVEFRLRTKSKRPTIGVLPAPLFVSGTLKEPRAAPDPTASTARGGLAGALAALPTIQLGIGDDPRCEGVLGRLRGGQVNGSGGGGREGGAGSRQQ
jgi:hypothetical protein